jgi:hypothetical protein
MRSILKICLLFLISQELSASNIIFLPGSALTFSPYGNNPLTIQADFWASEANHQLPQEKKAISSTLCLECRIIEKDPSSQSSPSEGKSIPGTAPKRPASAALPKLDWEDVSIRIKSGIAIVSKPGHETLIIPTMIPPKLEPLLSLYMHDLLDKKDSTELAPHIESIIDLHATIHKHQFVPANQGPAASPKSKRTVPKAQRDQAEYTMHETQESFCKRVRMHCGKKEGGFSNESELCLLQEVKERLMQMKSSEPGRAILVSALLQIFERDQLPSNPVLTEYTKLILTHGDKRQIEEAKQYLFIGLIAARVFPEAKQISCFEELIKRANGKLESFERTRN